MYSTNQTLLLLSLIQMFTFYTVSQSAISYMNQTPYINNPNPQIKNPKSQINLCIPNKLFWRKTYSADVSIIFFISKPTVDTCKFFHNFPDGNYDNPYGKLE